MAAACYPDYQFSANEPPGTGGGGAVGGGGGVGLVGGQGGIMVTSGGGHMPMGGNGGGGGFPTTTSSGGTGGVPVIPQVNCDAGMVLCNAGQVCCFDDAPPYSDVCGNPGGCPASYYEMKCDDHGDCSGADLCCGAFISDGWGAVTLTGTTCKAACAAGERPTCMFAANCSPNTCDEYWEGYNFCDIP